MEYLAPHSKEAEEAVLGCMLIDVDSVIIAAEKLEENDFFDHRNKAVFTAMMSLFNDNSAIDLITVVNYLESKGELKGVGGDTYIVSLGNSIVTTSNVEEYIAIIKEKSLLRRLSSIGSQLSKDAALEVNEAQEVLNKAESAIMKVGLDKHSGTLEHISKVLGDSYNDIMEATTRKGELIGVGTGFGELDRMTLGFQPSQLIVIGARPGDGKTSLALNVASHVALKEKKTVAIFNLEMSAGQLVKRMICSEAMVDLKKASEGSLSEDDFTKVNEAVRVLTNAPIYIDDTAGIGISGIRSKCRRLKLQKGLDMVVIDYLQLMKASGKTESRQLEVAELTRSLKILARELELPILVLSQLRRETEKRNKPLLSDLRESGSIEQDADTVILIHRYKSDDETTDLADFILAKQRSGPTGTISVGWRGDLTKFMDIESRY